MCRRFIRALPLGLFLFSPWAVPDGSASAWAEEAPPAADSTASSPEAQTAPASGSRTRLGEVLVSAERVPGAGPGLAAREFPGHATVVTAEEIEASGARSIPELLKFYDGVEMMDFSGFGFGADATLNLRGVVNSSRNGALVLFDGVRQNGLTGDEVHWQSLPLDQLERIEILRGGSGITYGEGAFAGVINLVTKKGADRPLVTEERLTWGNFGRQQYTLSARGASGPLTYGTSYTRHLLAGYRESTNSRGTTVTEHFGWAPASAFQVEADLLHSEDTTYFSGGITPAQSQQRRRQAGDFPGYVDDHTTQVSLDSRLLGPWGLAATIQAFVRERESDSVTAFGPLATLLPSEGLTIGGRHDLEVGALRQTLLAGIDLLAEKASTGLRSGDYSESNKAAYGLFLEDTVRLFDRVSLIGGVRFDKMHFAEDITFPAFEGTLRFEGWSPKAGISLDVADPLTLYANVARPFKAPNVFDFSVAVPFGFVGNAELQPQQGTEYEAGLRWADPRLGRFSGAWFLSRVDDEILFNALTFQNQNFDTRRMGVELSGEPVLPVPGLTVRVNYTFVEAEFRKGAFRDHTLPGTPEHQLGVHAAYEPVPGLVGSLDWLLVQDFFRINDFNNALPGDNYGVLNLGLRYTYRQVTVHFLIENVTNEEYTSFQSSDGLAVSTGENPAPPTAFSGGVTVEF